MKLLILAILVAVVGAGQIKLEDDSNVEVRVIKWEVRQIGQEPIVGNRIRGKHRHHHKHRKHHHRGRFRIPAADGWRRYRVNSYKVFRDAKNFDDAEERCNREGAHLVSIHSEGENEFVHSLTTTGHDITNFDHFVYIGLRKNTQTGEWYWTDGSLVNYRKWAINQPDVPETEHCAQLHQDPGPGLIYVEDRKWNSIACDRPMKYFVCKL